MDEVTRIMVWSSAASFPVQFALMAKYAMLNVIKVYLPTFLDVSFELFVEKEVVRRCEVGWHHCCCRVLMEANFTLLTRRLLYPFFGKVT